MKLIKKWIEVDDILDLKIKAIVTEESILKGKRVTEQEVLKRYIINGVNNATKNQEK